MAAPLVWINGHPGAGKFTVAKTMASRDPRVLVIDNHSLIDPVAKRLGPNSRDHPDYQKFRKAERDRVFQDYVLDPGFRDRIIVFTDIGPSVAQEYKAVAQEADRPFLPYHLHCDFEENMERALSQERMESDTTKLTDEKLLASILASEDPYMFPESQRIRATCKPPDEVARLILSDCHQHVDSSS